MNLHSIRDRIAESDRDDWHQIPCWAPADGPGYHFGLTSEKDDDRGIQTEARGHSILAVLIDDVDISIAWGYDPDDSLDTGFRPQFNFDFLPDLDDPDDNTRIYADVFYRGALVDRKLFVVADGARYYVPVPRRTYPNKTGNGPKGQGDPQFHYSRWEIGFAKLLNSFQANYPFDSVLEQMNFVIDD